ncbi:lipocalin family protein [Mangrovimonas sp. ST2L15]|uniref:lipocalin family protein n=1 Tax=Mangrovimonas sp. ST2L15 TaxID=1645916 RepID=UPI0006B5DCDB|nr:lipocalin family protein [Mangrovimonas sp. ST2L15]
MKKSLLLFMVVATIFSCGSTKTAGVSKKVMKGYWSLNSITYSESGEFNVNLLNDAEQACFEGSTWRFIPNNNTGNYTLSGMDCDSSVRNFVFSIQTIDKDTGLYDFMLKPTNAKHKSETNQGFRLKLAQLSESNMQWQQTVTLDDGKPFTIFMNFTKTSD